MADSTSLTESVDSTKSAYLGRAGTAASPPTDPWGASFYRLIGVMGPPLPHSDDPKRTARVIRLMLTMGVALSFGLIIWVMTEKINAPTLIWGLMAAGSAMLAGGGLGFLFGLPSRRTVDIRNAPATPPPAATVDPKSNLVPPTDGGGGQTGGTQSLPAPGATPPPTVDDGASQDTGYVESTNLERVAEWLTTMIIGLTLTQYGAWEARYFDLSRNVTMAMEIKLDVCEAAAARNRPVRFEAGRQGTRGAAGVAQSPADVAAVAGAVGTTTAPAPADVPSQTSAAANATEPTSFARDCFRAQAIPGGLLMAIFAIIGFLISYLWMRRYFIFEMVTARQEERQKYQRKLELDRIEADPVAKARADVAQAIAERDAAIERAKAEAEAAVAKARAEADAAAEKARAEADAAAAKAKAEADAAAVAITERLKASNSIVEESASRDPVSSAALQEIAEKTKAVAPQLNSVGDRLDAIIQQIANRGVTYPDDPWRGRLSEKAEEKDKENGYVLSAEAKVNELNANLFDLTITVHANDAAANAGKNAWFLLHPTFPDQPRRAAFDANGDAVLKLLTYGAFTVGAIMEDGTVLELNLAESAAPQDFRQR